MKERVYTQTFGAAGALIERDGAYLLVKENLPGDSDDGKWNQPAGWIEVGQSPVETAKKEVLEETGYSFIPEALLGVYSLWRKDLKPYGKTPHGIKFIFLGSADGGNRQPLAGDTHEAEWFTREEIEAMDPDMLRDGDILKMIRDYEAGKRYPMELITHTEQE